MRGTCIPAAAVIGYKGIVQVSVPDSGVGIQWCSQLDRGIMQLYIMRITDASESVSNFQLYGGTRESPQPVILDGPCSAPPTI